MSVNEPFAQFVCGETFHDVWLLSLGRVQLGLKRLKIWCSRFYAINVLDQPKALVSFNTCPAARIGAFTDNVDYGGA